MKIFAFSIVYGAIILSMFNAKVSWKAAFFISLLYVFFLRLGGLHRDFDTYLSELSSGWNSFFCLREPLFWVGSKLLYSIIGNELFVVLIYDVIFCVFLFLAFLKVSGVFYFLIALVSFPIFLGLENVYRQLLGIPFCLLFVFYCFSRKMGAAVFSLLISCLFQNLFLIFTPLLTYSLPRLSIGIRVFCLLVAICLGCVLAGFLPDGVSGFGRLTRKFHKRWQVPPNALV